MRYYTVVWWANTFTREEGSGVTYVCDLCRCLCNLVNSVIVIIVDQCCAINNEYDYVESSMFLTVTAINIYL